MTRTILCAAVIALLSSATAHADGELARLITKFDKARLVEHDAVRRGALAEARRGGNPQEFAAVGSVLDARPQSFSGFDMIGNWRCRVSKLGKTLPLVTYGWFRCRVTDDGSGWRLEKLTGSQRVAGRFFDDGDTRLVFLGVGYVAGETPKRYGAGPDSDEVGYAFRTGRDAFRIEFPSPTRESRFDLLELRR
ncbi:MAG: DUF4893 domain-containing protein [Mesorhizobium amorphae]|nr:MAG: DUF4893 domain-containing protein [Mesorhizobium amorphae]